jgi:hypothetical protein
MFFHQTNPNKSPIFYHINKIKQYVTFFFTKEKAFLSIKQERNAFFSTITLQETRLRPAFHQQ